MQEVVVVVFDDIYLEQSKVLAKKLGLSLLDLRNSTNTKANIKQQEGENNKLNIFYKEDLLYINNESSLKQKPLCIDFTNNKLLHRLTAQGVSEPLLKAINLKNRSKLKVLDATCGMARDSILLAFNGHIVDSIERNNILFELILNGVSKARKCAIPSIVNAVNRINFINANSEKYLNELLISNDEVYYDVIYLDPMFPEKNKTALVKKESQLLQSLHGLEDDGNLILNIALKSNCKKIVVKRPLHAPYLGNHNPTSSHKYKTTRFDIYIPLQ